MKLEIDDNMLIALEYIGVEEEGPVKEKEEGWLDGGEDEESEEDFEWVQK